MTGNLTASEAERKAVVRHLPLIRRISNEMGLRDLVLDAWVRLWRESGHKDIGDAPFRSELVGATETLVRHTEAVARMTLAAAPAFERVYGVTLSRDLLIAGAIIHDVDKLVTYHPTGSPAPVDKLGRELVHGVHGAVIAEQVGLPPEVVNVISSHSFKHPTAPPATIEAILIACCDQASFLSYRLMSGKGVFRKG